MAFPVDDENLPDLDPLLLLSPAAQREVAAAQGNMEQPLPSAAPPPDPVENLVDLWQEHNADLDSQVQSALEEPPQVRTASLNNLSDLWGGIEREANMDEIELPEHAQAPVVEPDLSALFMNREAQDALSAGVATSGPAPVSFPIEFDGPFEGSDISYSEPRRHYGSGGGSGGEVVSRRTASGFQHVERPRPPAMVQTTPNFRQGSIAQSIETPGPRKTMMQHILDDD